MNSMEIMIKERIDTTALELKNNQTEMMKTIREIQDKN